MAKFRKPQSELAQALNRLQNFGENLIAAETNRRIQLGREKESRMIEAYQYMLGGEEEKIQELEGALQSIEQNLEARGVELKSVKDEYKTIDSEELLAAANQGAMELVNAKLDDRRSYRESLQSKKAQASKIKRHIDMFDDALSITDPALYGDPGIIEAEDVANAAIDFMEAQGVLYEPEMQDRLKEMQTEGALEKLNTDYFARLAKDSQDKLTQHSAETTDSRIKIEALEDVKKETLEGVNMMSEDMLMNLASTYSPLMTMQGEIDSGIDAKTGESLKDSDIRDRETEISQTFLNLGVRLVPWAISQDQAVLEAKNLQSAVVKAGNKKYGDLINYLKKGHSQYLLWKRQGEPQADLYKEDIEGLLGVDISDKQWIDQISELWWTVGQSDIEQATEALKVGRDFLPEYSNDETIEDPLLREYGFE